MLIELTIDLPWTHFSPASITSHLELSIITGLQAMFGLGGDRVEEGHHGLLRIQQAFVHIDVDHLVAGLHLLAGDRSWFLGEVVALHDQLLELSGASDVGPLTDVDEDGSH